MNRWGTWGLFGLTVAALALSLAPTPARSAPRPSRHGRSEVQPAETSGFVYLGRRDGYEVALSIEASRIAVLSVGRFKQTATTTAASGTRYVTRTSSPVDDGTIRADFGRIGTVSLRFRRKGAVRQEHNQRGCFGRRPTTEMGSVHGTVHLHGERGYFHATFTHGGAELRHSFRLECKRGHAYEVGAKPLREYAAPGFSVRFSSAGGAIAVLYAAARRPGGFVELRAAHYQGSGPGAEVQLETLEGAPGRPVGRYAFLESGSGTLETSLPGERPATATLAPAAPFSGEANYVEQSRLSHGWNGSLKVALPGLDLPLAGHGWYTSLCVVSPLQVPDGCDFIKRKPLLPELPDARSLRWPG